MKTLTTTVVLTLAFCATAKADMYKWVDEQGIVHFGDRPQHVTALGMAKPTFPAPAVADQTADDNTQTQDAQTVEEYCAEVRDMYDDYVSAPSLYKTNEKGQREYLSARESRRLIGDLKARLAESCS